MFVDMSGQVVKRNRREIEACVTCPLCEKHYSEATTISECLHTFCKKCIYSKIIDEELDCCPKCNTYLGVAPLEKLRADPLWDSITGKIFRPDTEKVNAPADHNVQDTTAEALPSETKMVKALADLNVQDITEELLPFESRKSKALTTADDIAQDIEVDPLPSKRKKVKAPAVSSAPIPAKRKEKYLSSLAINSPQLSGPEMSGRRRYPTRRRVPLREYPSFQEPEKKEEDFHERLESPQTLKKHALYTSQNYTEGSSKQHMLNMDVEDNSQPEDVKPEIWKPLDRLVEAARKSSSDKINLQLQLPVSEPMLADALNNKAREVKPIMEYGNISKVGGSVNQSSPAPSGSGSFMKLQRGRKRKLAVPEGLNIPAQSLVDANNKCDRILRPIWFSLFASNRQKGFPPLPQLPSCYLRVKDGSVPASFIKRYLVKKLNLTSEDEVEVTLRDNPIVPTLQLHNLVDLWLPTTPALQSIQISIGSSAREYVMPLMYGRKMLPW